VADEIGVEEVMPTAPKLKTPSFATSIRPVPPFMLFVPSIKEIPSNIVQQMKGKSFALGGFYATPKQALAEIRESGYDAAKTKILEQQGYFVKRVGGSKPKGFQSVLKTFPKEQIDNVWEYVEHPKGLEGRGMKSELVKLLKTISVQIDPTNAPKGETLPRNWFKVTIARPDGRKFSRVIGQSIMGTQEGTPLTLYDALVGLDMYGRDADFTTVKGVRAEVGEEFPLATIKGDDENCERRQ